MQPGVRDATPNDLDALVRLGMANYEEQLVFDGDFRMQPGWEEYYRRLAQRMMDSDAYLVKMAVDGDEALGFSTGMISADPTWEDGVRGSLLDLYVTPAHRGRDAGTLLLESMVAAFEAAGATLVLLNVFVGNDEARRFWERHGFQPFMTRMKLRTGKKP